MTGFVGPRNRAGGLVDPSNEGRKRTSVRDTRAKRGERRASPELDHKAALARFVYAMKVPTRVETLCLVMLVAHYARQLSGLL